MAEEDSDLQSARDELDVLQTVFPNESVVNGNEVEVFVTVDIGSKRLFFEFREEGSDSASESVPSSLTPSRKKAAASDEAAAPSSVPVERTPTGLITSKHLQQLPPLVLRCTLPPNYPSKSPPTFTLLSCWMPPDELEKVCVHLDKIWEENSGYIVIYTWVTWLQTCVDTLFTDDQVISLRQGGVGSGRGVCELSQEGEGALMSLIEFDFRSRMGLFALDSVDCGICFTTYLGSEMIVLPSCRHVFCPSCVKSFLEIHITEGSCGSINCPQCRLALPNQLILTVVGQDLFDRYLEITRKRLLDADPTVCWCPNCGSQGTRFPEDLLGICSHCSFSFCLECEYVYHPGVNCDGEKLRPAGMNISEEVCVATGRKRANGEDEKASLKLISGSSVRCPSCRNAVEKSDGCNKMTCSMCKSYFCYYCGKKIEGYEHFEIQKCPLFDGQFAERPARVERAMAMRAAQMDLFDDEEDRPVQCVRCRQDCFRIAKNNHIKCWVCMAQFCFLEKVLITGTKHFGRGGCPQHGGVPKR